MRIIRFLVNWVELLTIFISDMAKGAKDMIDIIKGKKFLFSR